MKMVSMRERVENVTYSRVFRWKDDPNSGFSFPCEQDGALLPTNEVATANYNKCVNGEYEVVDIGVERVICSYVRPAVGVCERCGRHVPLENVTNTCDCGAEYNICGQRLAPRSQWGEETGERF